MPIDPNAVARVVGVETQFRDSRVGNVLILPQKVMLVGQGTTLAQATYSNARATVLTAREVGETYGFGSPLHLAAKQLLPENGDGIGTIPLTIYPLDDDGAEVTASGTITPSGAASGDTTIQVVVNNIASNPILITDGDSVADMVAAITAGINAILDMPLIAADDTTKVDITAKWGGATGNDIFVEIVGIDGSGITFPIVQLASGANNPDITAALALVGDTWETIAVNCLGLTDDANLDRYETFGEGRWDALVRKPLVVVTGDTTVAVGTVTAITDLRTADRTNVIMNAPGSDDLPSSVAARAVARIAAVANGNPPVDYARQRLTGLVPGTDGEQWTYAERESAVAQGASTTTVEDSVINLSDTITCYHPLGEQTPPYRYVVDIVKLQNIIFNLDEIFTAVEWAGAPLIPDDQPTTNRAAKQPKMAKAEIARMLDNLGLLAIISDPESAKAATIAVISDINPKRLDVCVALTLSGNVNIISVGLDFSFFFGTPTLVA